jgi:hypothetical protein
MIIFFSYGYTWAFVGSDETPKKRPNAGVKPPCGGAADACKRSAKHAAAATTRGRLERLVRREGSRRGRNPGALAENRSLDA